MTRSAAAAAADKKDKGEKTAVTAAAEQAGNGRRHCNTFSTFHYFILLLLPNIVDCYTQRRKKREREVRLSAGMLQSRWRIEAQGETAAAAAAA